MATLSIRIDEKLKKKANKTFAAMGLDMSSAVKIFLNQTVVEKGFPFKPTNNPKLIRAIWDKEVSEALRCGKRYTSTEKMFDDILNHK